MDYIAIILADLDAGFYKSDLEKLIGLPKNSLSGILKGDKKLSKKSALKIEKWAASEKPDPLDVIFARKPKKVAEQTSPDSKIEKLANKLKKPDDYPVKGIKEGSIEYRLRCIDYEENKSKLGQNDK